MQPLVSICIPCHNAEKYVEEAIESVLNQTYKNIELIVVDDGSTDRSGEVLEKYRMKGVKVVTEKCGSASKARNRALREARGEYIKFFDADDIISPKMIEIQIAKLNGRTNAVASSEWGRFYGDVSTFKSNPQSVWRDMEPTEWLVKALYDARPMMQPGMFLIPRDIIKTTGGWNEELTLIDDFEFFTRIFCHSKEILFTTGAILYYRSGNSGSLSAKKNRQAVESQYHSLLKGISHLLALRPDPAARLSCANMLQDFIYSHYPKHPDLCRELRSRILELGGSDLKPDGPPRFHQLKRFVGWKNARRIQRLFRK